MQSQQFGRGKPFIELEMFRQESDFAARLHIACGRAENLGLTARRAHEPEEHFDRRALSRAIRPKEPEDRSARHGEGKRSHRNFLPILLSKIVCFDCCSAGQNDLLERKRSKLRVEIYCTDSAIASASPVLPYPLRE